MSSPIDLDFDGSVGSTVNINKPTAPTTGVYGDLFQPLFGTLSLEDQQEVWVRFLHINNFTDPPPSDPGTQELFLKYASDVYAYLENKIVSERNFVIDLPLLKPPTTGFYATAFQSYFGGGTALEQQQVWAQFLLNNNFTIIPPPEDAVTEALFINYAAFYFGLDTTKPYNLALLDPPTTGFYGTPFQSYFADLSPLQQKKVWVQFLINNNYTNTPPPEDAATLRLFISFSTTVLTKIQNENVHSPDEVRKRYIMSQTLDSLLKMLAALQDNIGVESRNLIFYGTWQQEYTKMMARVPTYVGEPDSTVHVPPGVIDGTTTNFDAFTFGYDKISVSDIADYWASNSLNNDSTTFVMTSTARDLFGRPLVSITYTPQVGTSAGSISWTYNDGFIANSDSVLVTDPTNTPSLLLRPLTDPQFTATPAQGSRQLAQEAYAKAFKIAFATIWNNSLQGILSSQNAQNLTAINSVNAFNPLGTTAGPQPRSKTDTSNYSIMELPWGYGYVVPSAFHSNPNGTSTIGGKLSDDNAKARGEINAKLQNFIENIRGRRKLVQNAAQKLQTDLDTSRQTVTSQSDLLNSILQSITDLVREIAKR